VGINSIGMFLGNNDTRSETVVAHIDYVAQLVGADHLVTPTGGTRLVKSAYVGLLGQFTR
jgi:hypothetical protein